MQDLEWVRERLADRRIPIVAEKTGLSEPTIRDVREGRGNPTVKTIRTLYDYLNKGAA